MRDSDTLAMGGVEPANLLMLTVEKTPWQKGKPALGNQPWRGHMKNPWEQKARPLPSSLCAHTSREKRDTVQSFSRSRCSVHTTECCSEFRRENNYEVLRQLALKNESEHVVVPFVRVTVGSNCGVLHRAPRYGTKVLLLLLLRGWRRQPGG